MRAYRAVLSARFRGLLQYRAAAIAGLGTQLFWGFIRVMIFDGFYRSTTLVQPLSYRQVVTYCWLGQATLGLLLAGVDREVRDMIRSGAVAYELVRPLDLYGLWYTRSAAALAAPLVLRAAPLLTIAGLFLGLSPPHTPMAAAAWALTTLSALLLAAALWTLTTVTLLWTVSGEGVSRLVPALSYVLSGMVVPIPLMPPWAQPILYFLPFRGLMDIPFRLYLGNIPADQLWRLLAFQWAWILALVLCGRWLLARGIGRMVVQGG